MRMRVFLHRCHFRIHNLGCNKSSDDDTVAEKSGHDTTYDSLYVFKDIKSATSMNKSKRKKKESNI